MDGNKCATRLQLFSLPGWILPGKFLTPTSALDILLVGHTQRSGLTSEVAKVLAFHQRNKQNLGRDKELNALDPGCTH